MNASLAPVRPEEGDLLTPDRVGGQLIGTHGLVFVVIGSLDIMNPLADDIAHRKRRTPPKGRPDDF
jgi:hypothetical protein